MASIRDYHRPVGIDEALALLGRTDVTSVVLAGGTVVNADQSARPIEVVDLQALGLSGIDEVDGRVRIGAMGTLQEIVDSALVPELVREAARCEAPNTIRHMATIGGTVATADAESGLVAALLVHEATVEITSEEGTSSVPLPDLLGDRSSIGGAVIAAVHLQPHGATTWAGTGRTPVDTPIVSAYARVHDGRIRLAFTGVAATPVLVDPSGVSDLDPPADFRGSSEYRRRLAQVLASRVLQSLEVAP